MYSTTIWTPCVVRAGAWLTTLRRIGGNWVQPLLAVRCPTRVLNSLHKTRTGADWRQAGGCLKGHLEGQARGHGWLLEAQAIAPL